MLRWCPTAKAAENPRVWLSWLLNFSKLGSWCTFLQICSVSNVFCAPSFRFVVSPWLLFSHGLLDSRHHFGSASHCLAVLAVHPVWLAPRNDRETEAVPVHVEKRGAKKGGKKRIQKSRNKKTVLEGLKSTEIGLRRQLFTIYGRQSSLVASFQNSDK